MKKLFITILAASCLIACSSDDSSSTNDSNNNNNNNNSEMQLSSYNRIFPSGNSADYNFEDGKLIDNYSNGSLSGAYEYDAQDRMISYTKYSPNTGDIDNSYTFSYNENNQITSIEEFDKYPSSDNPQNYTVPVTYNNNTITAKIPTNFFPDNDDENPKDILEFTLNENGYVINSKYTDSDQEVKANVNYTYDSNFNCVQYEYVGGTSNVYTHEYDSAPNPVEDFYKEYYVQNLIIYGRLGGFGSYNLPSIVDTFGGNNRTVNGYPEGTPETSQTFLEYTYNDNGYPVKADAKYSADPSIFASETTFNY